MSLNLYFVRCALDKLNECMLCVVGKKLGNLFSKKTSIDHCFGRVFAAGDCFPLHSAKIVFHAVYNIDCSP